MNATTNGFLRWEVGRLKEISYDPTKIFGHGTQGIVYRGTCIYDNNLSQSQTVAIKKMKKNTDDHNLRHHLKQELEVLFSIDLDHKNIVKAIDVLHKESEIYMVFEFCEGMNLEDFLRKGKLAEREAQFYFSQLADALRYC